MRRRSDDKEMKVKIVGPGDEGDATRGIVRSTSLIARAMLGLTAGDRFELDLGGKRTGYEVLESA